MTEVEHETPQEPAQEPVEAPETPPEPEPEPGPEQEEPETPEHPDETAMFNEKEAEKGRRRIDRAVTSLVKTLQEVLADEAQYLQPCPRCANDFPGLVWDPTVKQVLPETRAAVMISMGENPDPQYLPDPRANKCPTCDGWGRVSTGSKVNRQDTLDCTECQGRGWIGPRAATIGTVTTPVPVPAAGTNGDTSQPTPDTDPWGRVRGEKLFGVMPGFEQ